MTAFSIFSDETSNSAFFTDCLYLLDILGMLAPLAAQNKVSLNGNSVCSEGNLLL